MAIATLSPVPFHLQYNGAVSKELVKRTGEDFHDPNLISYFHMNTRQSSPHVTIVPFVPLAVSSNDNDDVVAFAGSFCGAQSSERIELVP